MPNDQHSSPGRRPHYHRGRRGNDRRGPDRRTPQQHAEAAGGHRDHVDVEQIMRDIRSRIAKRHGIDLTPQQIQELAARRLDAILEPRHVKPALMEQMRRAAGEPIDVPVVAPEPGRAVFEESALYDSHRGIVRLLRKWLNPILKLFFNPTPIAQALNEQARRASEAAQREAEMYARQAEWNALHFEILQRLVTEVARTSIETQNLAMRAESLATRVDFNERRVRSVEGLAYQRGGGRTEAMPSAESARPAQVAASSDTATTTVPSGSGDAPAAPGEGARRRRRRRRGRRSGAGMMGEAAAPGTEGQAAAADLEADLEGDTDNDEGEPAVETGDVSPDAPEAPASLEPAHTFSLLQPVEHHPTDDSPPAVEVVETTASVAPEPVPEPEPAEARPEEPQAIPERPEPGSSDR
jgi:hypothetical protein